MFNVPPPTIVSMETTLSCPGDCIMCPRKQVLAIRRNKVMPDTMVYKVLDELPNWNPTIQWGWINEPLADKRLFDFIAYSRNLSLKGWINTNGALLNNETIPLILNSGLSMVNIAVDSMDRNKYEKSRRGLDFDKVMKNILQFIIENNRLGHPVKTMVSQIVIPGYNDNEYRSFSAYWSPLVDQVQHPLYRVRGGEWDSTFPLNTPTCKYCYFIENEMNITTDGDVPLCACDAICATPEANVESGVYNAWNTPERAKTIDKIRRYGMNSLGFCREHSQEK